jgi:prepilin-type processing-associated H-X9-DG protein
MKATRPFGSPKNPIPGYGGFTVVELLAVIVMIAILAIVLLPALAGTKSDPRAFQCLNNQRQLILGWQMYAADNNDLLPANDFPFLTAYRGAGGLTNQMHNWVVGTMASPLDANSASAACIAELSDPNTELSPYVKNYTVYHCPADNYANPLNSGHLNVRSYSMNAAVGTCNWTHYNAPNYALGSAVGEGWLRGAYSNTQLGPWLTYGKLSSFTRPGPSKTFVILDENPYSINDGSFAAVAVATPGNTYLVDWPSGLHGAAGVISFADGHVIIHKWQDQRTYTPQGFISPGRGGASLGIQSPDNPDCFYLAPITSAPR